MNKVKMSMCLFGGALLGAGLSSPAEAQLNFNGALTQPNPRFGYDYGSSSYALSFGSTTIDTFDFSVFSDGQIQFDILSYRASNTWLDSEIFLFNNDGNPLGYGNFIVYNDDSYSDFNGSTSPYDSFIDIFLTSGEYTIAVASVLAQLNEIDTGMSGIGFIYGTGGNGIPTQGEYQLDIFGDVGVPTPGTLVLLGLSGFVAIRRRR